MTERVWDRFFTEQDKAWLAKAPHREPRDPRTFCERPALLMVDFFRGAFGDAPEPILEQMEQWPGTCGLNAWNALEPTQRLLSTCRELSLPIIHTTGVTDPNILGQHRRQPPLPGDQSPQAKKFIPADVRYEIIPEVAPLDGEAVINKITSSAFWGTPLIGHLIRKKVDTLIICGEVTEGCVAETVADASAYGFNIILVEDCTFTRLEAVHAMYLFHFQRVAEILSIDETLSFLKDSF